MASRLATATPIARTISPEVDMPLVVKNAELTLPIRNEDSIDEIATARWQPVTITRNCIFGGSGRDDTLVEGISHWVNTDQPTLIQSPKSKFVLTCPRTALSRTGHTNVALSKEDVRPFPVLATQT